MSAYSASPPVTTRNTAPSTAKPCQPCSTKNDTACRGSIAVNTTGFWTSDTIPSAAMTMNQRTMIGPNNRPTRCVPWRWIANTPIRMTTVTGTT